MSKIIEFNSHEQRLAKVQAYTDSIELVMEQTAEAIPFLCRAFKHTPVDLKLKIILLLGSFPQKDVAWTLYHIMTDAVVSEEIRQAASVQLSVTASFLRDPQPIVDTLVSAIKEGDSIDKRLAAFALGWEGNAQAAIPLIELLYDTDTDVQQAAVNALANLRDDRILNLLLERLEHGPLDQKRAILYNLWRFYSRREEVVAVYLKYLEHPDEDLRFDALVLLGPVVEAETYLETYARCLHDSNPRVRRLALEYLLACDAKRLAEIYNEISRLITDPDHAVKRLAIQCVHKINPNGHIDDPT
jgi:HEAT repeat protein